MSAQSTVDRDLSVAPARPGAGPHDLADRAARRRARPRSPGRWRRGSPPGRRVEVLDGDEVRAELLTADLGFSRADRDENVRRIGYVAELLSRHGVEVVCAVDLAVPRRA